MTKRGSETGSTQGDGSLAGAAYGGYWGDRLIDTYTTNAAGQFTINCYSYSDNWSICEIAPSGGYLLDTEPPTTTPLNTTALSVRGIPLFNSYR